jgi:hypothetical protein
MLASCNCVHQYRQANCSIASYLNSCGGAMLVDAGTMTRAAAARWHNQRVRAKHAAKRTPKTNRSLTDWTLLEAAPQRTAQLAWDICKGWQPQAGCNAGKQALHAAANAAYCNCLRPALATGQLQRLGNLQIEAAQQRARGMQSKSDTASGKGGTNPQLGGARTLGTQGQGGWEKARTLQNGGITKPPRGAGSRHQAVTSTAG